MPKTAEQYGVKNSLDPADNIQGAVKFLKWLDGFWRQGITDDDERMKFVLASYNAGAGHIEDAQHLTDKYGGNSQSWEDVSYLAATRIEAAILCRSRGEVWLLSRG